MINAYIISTRRLKIRAAMVEKNWDRGWFIHFKLTLIIIDCAFGSAHVKSAFDPKSVLRRSSRLAKRAKREERLSRFKWNQSNLIGSNVELHLSLIGWIGLGSCAVRRLTRTLARNCPASTLDYTVKQMKKKFNCEKCCWTINSLNFAFNETNIE